MRIYHNFTADSKIASAVCGLACEFDHVDLCEISPSIANFGRFWRLSSLGDPTVSRALFRDIDSFILDREIAAVEEWLDSGLHFHVMRDNPRHRSPIQAGLWAAHNYADLDRAQRLKNDIFASLNDEDNVDKYFDQKVLKDKVWPVIKSKALVHDSYYCQDIGRPFPTQRQNFTYVGFGPTKSYAAKLIQAQRCPLDCRPERHKDWEYC